jgi:hypothetical protein
MGGTVLVGAPQGCDSAWREYEWLWRTGSNVESIVAYFKILSRYLRNSIQCLIGFWRWCTAHRITGVWDIFHRPVFLDVETRRFGNWICFRLQVKEEKTPTQLGPLGRANLNHCFYFQKHRRMEKVQTPSNFVPIQCYQQEWNILRLYSAFLRAPKRYICQSHRMESGWFSR